ncbi:MAG: hypothetical protein AB7S44_01925 [Spirochaetales bacterium]
MKTFKNYVLVFALIVSTAFVNSISVAFGFMDNTTSATSLTLGIGTWDTSAYSTGFESFTNTNTGTLTLDIDGLSWELNNVVQSQSGDITMDTTAARILQNGSMTSVNYFTGLQVISLYVAMSKLQGAFTYSVYISDNGTQWTAVIDQHKPPLTYEYNAVDVNALIQAGLTLASGATATTSTPLKIKIECVANKSLAFLIDNLDFSYSDIS